MLKAHFNIGDNKDVLSLIVKTKHYLNRTSMKQPLSLSVSLFLMHLHMWLLFIQVGPDGAGHFVKMVHNGIEYGDMQLICEAYHLMKDALGMSQEEMADVRLQINATLACIYFEPIKFSLQIYEFSPFSRVFLFVLQST